jgi:hypothetical protein
LGGQLFVACQALVNHACLAFLTLPVHVLHVTACIVDCTACHDRVGAVDARLAGTNARLLLLLLLPLLCGDF